MEKARPDCSIGEEWGWFGEAGGRHQEEVIDMVIARLLRIFDSRVCRRVRESRHAAQRDVMGPETSEGQVRVAGMTPRG